jgi:hypothetical protein
MTNSRCNLRYPPYSSSLSNTSAINVKHIETAEEELEEEEKKKERTKMRRRK